MSELSEDSKFEISIKTLIAIGVGLSTLIGMWFALQADIHFMNTFNLSVEVPN